MEPVDRVVPLQEGVLGTAAARVEDHAVVDAEFGDGGVVELAELLGLGHVRGDKQKVVGAAAGGFNAFFEGSFAFLGVAVGEDELGACLGKADGELEASRSSI